MDCCNATAALVDLRSGRPWAKLKFVTQKLVPFPFFSVLVYILIERVDSESRDGIVNFSITVLMATLDYIGKVEIFTHNIFTR